MKKYYKPSIRFNRVRSCNVIVTSDPLIFDDPANPDKPSLAPKRGKDWKDW